jgi:hypothetical protein
VTFAGIGRTLHYRCRFTFEPVPQGTRIRIVGTAQLRGWRRVMEPMMRAAMRKAVPQQLARMRACLQDDAAATTAPGRSGGAAAGLR